MATDGECRAEALAACRAHRNTLPPSEELQKLELAWRAIARHAIVRTWGPLELLLGGAAKELLARARLFERRPIAELSGPLIRQLRMLDRGARARVESEVEGALRMYELGKDQQNHLVATLRDLEAFGPIARLPLEAPGAASLPRVVRLLKGAFQNLARADESVLARELLYQIAVGRVAAAREALERETAASNARRTGRCHLSAVALGDPAVLERIFTHVDQGSADALRRIKSLRHSQVLWHRRPGLCVRVATPHFPNAAVQLRSGATELVVQSDRHVLKLAVDFGVQRAYVSASSLDAIEAARRAAESLAPPNVEWDQRRYPAGDALAFDPCRLLGAPLLVVAAELLFEDTLEPVKATSAAAPLTSAASTRPSTLRHMPALVHLRVNTTSYLNQGRRFVIRLVARAGEHTLHTCTPAFRVVKRLRDGGRWLPDQAAAKNAPLGRTLAPG